MLVELDTTGPAAPVPFHEAVVLLLVRERVIAYLIGPMEAVPNHALKLDRYVAGSEKLGMLACQRKLRLGPDPWSPVKRNHCHGS